MWTDSNAESTDTKTHTIEDTIDKLDVTHFKYSKIGTYRASATTA
jgi:hypothetical protein